MYSVARKNSGFLKVNFLALWNSTLGAVSSVERAVWVCIGILKAPSAVTKVIHRKYTKDMAAKLEDVEV